MELILKTPGRGRKPEKIKVTDCKGNFKIFNTTKHAAEYLECKRQTIYNCLHNKTTIRGCDVEFVED